MTARDLQKEAERARYSLRASFFYRAHRAWPNLAQQVEMAARRALSWNDKSDWGISDTAWERISAQGIQPGFVFSHPQLIQDDPSLIAYYRHLALLPQKGIQRFGVSTQALEEGKGRPLDTQRATAIARIVNSFICLLIDSDHNWTMEGARTAAILNLGTQMNGSWRNEVGAEGGRRVKELLVTSFSQQGLIRELRLADGTVVAAAAQLPPLATIASFTTTNEYTVAFGSEPDVAIRAPQDTLASTIEVKYGLDPAGALERYGAAKKSFEQATRENRRVVNIYLASCLTPEVRRRIDDDRLVNEDFNLTQVLGDSAKRAEFLAHVRHTVNL
ncbi:MAG: XcyI family restriction endonuclease [Chloroflexi bacterium]|nr:XcyI family restriction endonuclease [Chloroflexota bacterium]